MGAPWRLGVYDHARDQVGLNHDQYTHVSKVSNAPLSTVRRWKKMTFKMIQPIGKNPKAAPSSLARTANPTGIGKIRTATPIATKSAMIAAIGAFTLLEPISASSVTTGSAAASVDRAALSSGLSTCTWPAGAAYSSKASTRSNAN